MNPGKFLLLCGALTPPLSVLTSQSLDPEAPGFLQPAAVYREYSVNHRNGSDWRVTDPGVTRSDARIFLPNADFTIQGVETPGVTRADIMLAHWLGHSGTTGQVFTFNDSDPIGISLETPYSDKYRAYPLNMDNPVFDLPLEQLNEGTNTYSGSIAENRQGVHWWGQWGWYALFLRTYLEPSATETVARIANISSGDVITDNPEIIIEASSPGGIRKIEVFAKYDGYDENGDYVFHDWHYFFHYYQGPESHVGTILPTDEDETSHSITWNTEWIPDQETAAISLVARVMDSNGLWTVTEVVTDLTLQRPHNSVKMFLPGTLPIALIRANVEAEISIRIPEGYPLQAATGVRMPMRTWNGANNESGYTPLKINGSDTLDIIRGTDHYYHLGSPEVDPGLLRSGDNILHLTSATEHHGCEVLLPGPAFLVKWDQVVSDFIDGSRTPSKSGWYNGWFGHFYYTYKSRWVYLQNLGWMYWNPPTKADQQHGWFYSHELGWVFLNEDLLPLVYFFEIEEWKLFEALWKP